MKSRKQKGKGLGFDRKEIAKTGKFLIAWILAFLLIYYGAVFAIGWQNIELFTAGSSAKVLQSFDSAKVTVLENTDGVFLKVHGIQIQISDLCTGWLETALLASAILASLGIAWKKRIYGAIGALIFGFAFNQLRIFVTIMQLFGTNVQTAELTHDVFFRLSLLIVIAGFYFVWFRKATKARIEKKL
ncbi:MAG: exosortase/archaeosortase family protein [Candidatus Diapherotrites archaeon]|nr:exosortase/archaeosortase family protein [Candidatus Diapherotrites archaeon]